MRIAKVPLIALLLAAWAQPATLILSAAGNWSAAGTWFLADATCESDSEAANTALGVAVAYSANCTPGVITVDGILVKIASRNAVPNGTMTVVLRNTTAGADVASVMVNVADIDAAPGAHFFYFGPQLLLVANNYAVGALTSVAGQVNLYVTAGTNWTRELRTTTNQAPAANDKLFACGELTGAGAGNSWATTVNGDFSGTSLGDTAFPQSVHVGKRGTVSFSTGAAANPKIKWKGVLGVYGGGTLNVGLVGTPIPVGSVAAMLMDVAVNVDSGIMLANGSTTGIYGVVKTTTQTLLTADAAALQPVLTVASTAGAAAGDGLGIASTTQTAAQCEKKIVFSVDSPTQFTLTTNLGFAHSGTPPTQGEVINLTRNVRIYGTSAALQGYVYIGTTAVVTIRYAEFYWLGSNTASKRGIDVTTTTGTFDMQYSALHDFTVASSLGVYVTGASASGVTFSNNVTYLIALNHFVNTATSGTWIVDRNVFMANTGGNGAVFLGDIGGVFTNNTVIGSLGTTIVGAIHLAENAIVGTFSGNTAHSSTGPGFTFVGAHASTFSATTAWRNSTAGVLFITGAIIRSVVMDELTLFGNGTDNVFVTGALANVTFRTMVSNGDTTFATTNGINLASLAAASGIVCESCDFSTVAGIKTAHTNDINFGGAGRFGQFILRNTKLGGTNPVANLATAVAGSYVASQRHGTTAGNHGVWRMYGLTWIDATAYAGHTPPSLRMTPSSAANKLESAPPDPSPVAPFQAAVLSGGTLTVTVRVRKSVAGDGVAYNGNQPRLIVRKNVPAGIAADLVLATAAGAAGAWETLTGVTAAVTDNAILEFVVNCDGTLGWVNVDTFAAAPAGDGRDFLFWFNGVPDISGGGGVRRYGIVQ